MTLSDICNVTAWDGDYNINPVCHNNRYVPVGSAPWYYKLPVGATDLQDLIEFKGMSFSLGSIFKSCYSIGSCNSSDKLKSLREIAWLVDRLIKEEEEGRKLINGK